MFTLRIGQSTLPIEDDSIQRLHRFGIIYERTDTNQFYVSSPRTFTTNEVEMLCLAVRSGSLAEADKRLNEALQAGLQAANPLDDLK